MNRRPERLGDLLLGVLAQLAATHTATNGEPPMAESITTYDEDDQARRRGDAICENAIAAALIERFGFVPLSLRYRLAREAVQACRAEVEPMQQRIRYHEAGGAA